MSFYRKQLTQAEFKRLNEGTKQVIDTKTDTKITFREAQAVALRDREYVVLRAYRTNRAS